MSHFRTNGAIGALLDEYEKALQELKTVVADVTDEQLVAIVDTNTKDEDCRSIQAILRHLVRAGYGYAVMIRNNQGEQLGFVTARKRATIADCLRDLDAMFAYTERVFADYPTANLDERSDAKKIHTRWGQVYDIDQLLEHAVMHIHRHRRQIQRFLLAS